MLFVDPRDTLCGATGGKLWGAYSPRRIPRVVFGRPPERHVAATRLTVLGPNRDFLRDAGNGTRGRVRSPENIDTPAIQALFVAARERRAVGAKRTRRDNAEGATHMSLGQHPRNVCLH